jgi:serine protease Do
MGQTFARGKIGISVDTLSDAMREEYGVPTGGVLVQDVIPNGAGEKSGLKAEDVITDFNGVPVTDPDQFIKMVQTTPPGTKVQVTVMRGKKPVTLEITLGSDKSTDTTVGALPGDTPALNEELVGVKVVNARSLNPFTVRMYNLPTNGVVVSEVTDGSPAAEAGLAPGDVIERIGQTDIASDEEFWTVLSKQMAISKHGVLLHIKRGNNPTRIITMEKITAPAEK